MAFGEILEPGADLAALEKAADECFETPLSCLAPDDLSDRLVALARITAKVDALRLASVRAADHVDIARLTDQRNTANHLAQRTNIDPGVVRFDQRLANWLSELPELREAHREGRIHVEHLDKLRRADNPRCHQRLIADQHKFVIWFTRCHFRDLDHVIDQWLLGADPDGAEPKEQQPSVGLSIRPLPGGMAKVSGILDPLQAASLRGEVEAEAAALRNKDKETGITSTVRRRTLDALLNLVGRGAARPDGTHARPRVNIVLSQRVYEKTLAWLADPAENQFPELDRDDIDKKCQLIDGTPIHPLYALAATATATFRRLVYGARGRPIDVSIDARRIPDWMRDVTLVTTNGKCSNPVCDAPFGWLHADHVTPYSHTHSTKLDETRPMCEGDNLWRGNDVTRGVWPTDIGWGAHDVIDHGDDDDEDFEAEVAHQTELARARIRQLVAAAA